jgi:hypothetical protein
MANLNQLIDVWVVYKNKKSQIKLEGFKDTSVDDIISSTKRVPIIPDDCQILEIGVGNEFKKTFTKKYKL